jgi:hypothetical protein
VAVIRFRSAAAWTALLLVSCSGGDDGPPSLLTESSLDGDWRPAVTSSGTSLPICGEAFPSRDGEETTHRVDLLSQPDEHTLVAHEIIQYQDGDAAEAAMAVVDAPGCSAFTRPDGSDTASVQVEEVDLRGHDDTAALQLVVTWADRSGQGYVVTATRYGRNVSHLIVDALQGGVPSEETITGILDAVESSR